MKRGTPDHPKVLRFQQTLGINRPMAVGLLELLWQYTAKFAPQGDVGRWNDETIAQGVYWDGDPGQLIAALESSGLIDAHKRHRYVVHDWFEHAEDSIHLALARQGKRFASGEVPKLNRFNKQEREELEKRFRAHKCARPRMRAHKCAPTGAEMRVPCALPSPPLPSQAMPSQIDARAHAVRTDAHATRTPDRSFEPSAWYRTAEERLAAETEALDLTRKLAELTGEDPMILFAEAQHYPGATRQKINPATMTADRLANTIIDLKKSIQTEEEKRARAKNQERVEERRAAMQGGRA
jgi:hypothetical protein